MTIYRVFAQISSIDGIELTTYGIAAVDENSTVIAAVHGISTSFDKVSRLCELCQRLELSACHLRDVCEDFIISDSY